MSTMSTELWLKRLEVESKALKAAYQRSASSIPIYSHPINFNTARNQVTINYTGGSSVQNDPERVIVTYATSTGSNTIAKLEVVTDNSAGIIVIRRVPYVGGARWSITQNSKDPSVFTTTNYTFTVRSMIDGTLSAAEMTS